MLVFPGQHLPSKLVLCFFVLPATLISSTYTVKNSPLARLTKKNIPNLELCPNRTAIGFSQIASPIIVLPKGDRTDSVQEERLGLPYWTMILAICARGRRIQISGHSDFGFFNNDGASSIFTWVYADTASAACPAQPDSLEMMSMTFAAVIWDADDPCSVNIAYAPESSSTMSPRSTTLPLAFWF